MPETSSTDWRLGYSPDEIGQAGGPGKSEVYEALRSGELKAKKFGRRTIIPADEARRWIASLPDWTPAVSRAAE